MKQAEKVIGSNTYRVTALGALKGREVFIRVVKLMGSVVDGLGKGDAVQAFAKVTENLADADLAFLCDVFGRSSEVVLPDGRAPRVVDVFDLHFSDNYLEMVKWLVFCLEVNFSSFFLGLRGALESVASAKQQAQKPAA